MVNSEILRLAVLVVVCLCPVIFACGYWNNRWDSPLSVQCRSKTQFVSYVKSKHSCYRHDRRYRMMCRSLPTYTRPCSTSCYWTGYVNSYRGLLNYRCPGVNAYINGFKSVHHNSYEDRVWKVRCCKAHGLYLYGCSYTGWTNGYRGLQQYTVPQGRVMVGAYSVYASCSQDRRWKYLTCLARSCAVTDGSSCKESEEDDVSKINEEIPAIEDQSRDESQFDIPAIEEFKMDGSDSDLPDISVSDN